MRDVPPDLNLQLIILAGMALVAIGGALLIERRIQRRRALEEFRARVAIDNQAGRKAAEAEFWKKLGRPLVAAEIRKKAEHLAEIRFIYGEPYTEQAVDHAMQEIFVHLRTTLK